MTLPLIILEGGDCAGKTTLAEQLQRAMPDAHYVHYSDYKHVKKSLPRMYVEGMMPAVLGHAPVIMDRCWLSEEPYCRVFRPDETPRLDWADVRQLERLAMVCEPLVVYCDPGWRMAREKFMERKGKDPNREYLDNEEQLKGVREWYGRCMSRSHLTRATYDWTIDGSGGMVRAIEDRVTALSHTLFSHGHLRGVGSSLAQVLVVGDEFAKHQEFDPHFQWPFCSFGRQGCSRWLSTQLDKHSVPERALWWVNQDQMDDVDLYSLLKAIPTINTIVALGDKAYEACANMPALLPVEKFPHPQWWKRFNHHEDYAAVVRIKELIV